MEFSSGLEILGMNEPCDADLHCGVFAESVIENVVLPPTLKRIERETFEDCGHLRNIVFPDSFEYIGIMCFKACALGSVTFPASLEEIEKGAFYGNLL